MTVTPSPFKIGGGSVTIKFTISENANVTVDVFSGTTLVKNLATNQAKLAGTVSMTWDGTYSSTQYVADGEYTVKVRAVDSIGNSGEASANVTGAAVPAVTGVAVSPAIFNPPDDGNAVLEFSVSRAAYVTVNILKSTMVVKTITTNTLLAPDIVHNFTWDGTDNNNKLLADGTYIFQIDAVSPTVSTYKSTVKTNIIVEAASPTVTGLSVTPTIVKVGFPATLRYTVSEPATITVSILKSDGTAVRTFPDEIKIASGSFTKTWDAKDDYGINVPDGGYKLKVDVVDNYFNPGSAEFVFSIGDIPVITGVSAVPNDINLDAMEFTKISYTVSTRSIVNVSILDSLNKAFKVVSLNKDVTASDAVYWDGYGTLGVCVPGTYTYKIEATSKVGTFKAVPVTGSLVVTGTPGAKAKACIDCHTDYPTAHPMTNCASCHGAPAPLENCVQCHQLPTPHILQSRLVNYHTSVIDARVCKTCHTPTYSTVPSHSADLHAFHNATLAEDCLRCHRASISAEHPRRLDATGKALDCNTCHKSTDPVVQQAIVNNDTACGACHSTTIDHETLHETTLIDANCTTASGCHKQSLTQEHLNNPLTQTDAVTGLPNNLTCETCHTSRDPKVIGSLNTGNKHCAACHTQGHNFNFAEPIPADIPLYLGYFWSTPQDANLWAGETKVPAEFLIGGKVIISNRVAGVTGTQITDYYINEMFNQGWTETAITSYSGPAICLQYAKDRRKAIIWAYGGSYLDDPTELPGGWRIEIVYQ
jgi:flagellar hook assembly protein FlgD